MLGAVDFRRLGEHAGTTVPHQLVDGPAEGGVRGDAGVTVGAAAVGGEDELGDRLLRAPGLVGDGQQPGHLRRRALHRLADAAGLLDVDDEGLALGMAGGGHPLAVHEHGGLVHLAAEPHQDVGRDVRVLGVAGKDALQRQVILAEELGAAARLVGDGEHAVDVRVVARHVPEAVLHELAHTRRAVDAGDHGHVVARAHAAILAPVAVERAHLLERVVLDGRHVHSDFVAVGRQLADAEVVAVDVVPDGDVLGGETDDLPVTPHRRPRAHSVARYLVSGLDDLPISMRAPVSSSTVPGASSALAMATSSSGRSTMAFSESAWVVMRSP
jgi:hypothetical protein